MNRCIPVLIVTVLIAGCSAPRKTENVNASPVNPARPAATPSVTPSPAVETETPAAMPAGERIDKPQTVRFEGTKFPAGWQWIDPDSQFSPTPHETKGGHLIIRIVTTKDLYGENRTAPRLLKAVEGDFQIETRLRFDPSQDYQGAGLLIWLDGENYLRFERSFGGVGEGGSGIRLDVRNRNKYESLTTPGEIPTTADEVELKIVRRLNVFTAFWREDESGEWRQAEQFVSNFPSTVMAGIVGCSTAEEITADFAYIRLLPQPVTRPF